MVLGELEIVSGEHDVDNQHSQSFGGVALSARSTEVGVYASLSLADILRNGLEIGSNELLASAGGNETFSAIMRKHQIGVL